MSDAVFVYGTLMVPEIWQAVTRTLSPPQARPALLHGYQRRKVEAADFPGIFATGNENDFVRGYVYENILANVFDQLDRYEDQFYQRVEIVVEIEDTSSKTLACQTYLIPPSERGILSNEPWELEWFKANALDRYLKALGI